MYYAKRPSRIFITRGLRRNILRDGPVGDAAETPRRPEATHATPRATMPLTKLCNKRSRNESPDESPDASPATHESKRKCHILSLALSDSDDDDDAAPQLASTHTKSGGAGQLLKVRELLGKASEATAAFEESAKTQIEELRHKQIEERRHKLRAEAALRAETARRATLEKELKDTRAQLNEANALLLEQRQASASDVLFIYRTLMRKLSDALSQAYDDARTSAVPVNLWRVLLDDGTWSIADSDVVDAYVRELCDVGASGEIEVEGAYSKTHRDGSKSVYDLIITMDSVAVWPDGIHVEQVNRATGKRREVALSTHSPSSKMNTVTIPLTDVDGNYIFQTELELLNELLAKPHAQVANMVLPSSEGFRRLAFTFSAPFRGFRFPERGDSESWYRLKELSNFVYFGRKLFEGTGYKTVENPHCFVWAHGTDAPASISDDFFGMNATYNVVGAKGKGIYVASNDYVPSAWSSHKRSDHKPTYVLGVALGGDPSLIQRYRMTTDVPGEAADWKRNRVKNAIYMTNPQLSCAVPLGKACPV